MTPKTCLRGLLFILFPFRLQSQLVLLLLLVPPIYTSPHFLTATAILWILSINPGISILPLVSQQPFKRGLLLLLPSSKAHKSGVVSVEETTSDEEEQDGEQDGLVDGG